MQITPTVDSCLNLRSRPRGRKIKCIRSGVPLDVISRNSSWIKVRTGNQVGYIYSPRNRNTSKVTNTGFITPKVSGCLNFRRAPNGRKLGCLNSSTKLKRTGRTRGSWIEVEHNGKTGYVYSPGGRNTKKFDNASSGETHRTATQTRVNTQDRTTAEERTQPEEQAQQEERTQPEEQAPQQERAPQRERTYNPITAIGNYLDRSKIQNEAKCIASKLSLSHRGRRGDISPMKRINYLSDQFTDILANKMGKSVSGTYRRHIWSQLTIESDYFRANTEYGNGSASKIKGGKKYLGRGPMQLTHNYNYACFTAFYLRSQASDRKLDDPKVVNPVCTKASARRYMRDPKITRHPIFRNPSRAFNDRTKSGQKLSALSGVWYILNKVQMSKSRRSSRVSTHLESTSIKSINRVTRAINGGQNRYCQRIAVFQHIGSCFGGSDSRASSNNEFKNRLGACARKGRRLSKKKSRKKRRRRRVARRGQR